MNIFFSDNDIRNLLQKDQKGENKILAKQFLKIIMFLNKKDYNPQKNIDNYLFEFRKTLDNVGFSIKNDNLEIFPEQLIPFILVKLNAELCEIAIPKNKEIEKKEKKVFSILTKNKYYVDPSWNDEQLIFSVILNIHKDRFSSVISRNFMNFIKIKKSDCENCSENSKIKTYFSWIYFFNITLDEYTNLNASNNNQNINLFFERTEFKFCKHCNNTTKCINHISIYKPSRNLILILSRGKNYEDKRNINSYEKLSIIVYLKKIMYINFILLNYLGL